MKHFRMGLRVAAGLAFISIAGGIAAGCGSDDTDDPLNQQTQTPVGAEDQDRIDKGLAMSPVILNLNGLDRNLVGLGSYIVNAQAACNDCHTNPPFSSGSNPYQGQVEQINTANFLAGGMTLAPNIVSTNLTPDGQGLPGGMTFEVFLARMRTGQKEDGSILQIMPWPVYAKMRDDDLRAVYEYLRAIPHAEPGTVAPPTPP
ncbi:cytochrome C [Myxococcus sp. K15C18031901]|uniref:cytochrome C n=1 Tax=Myxococcus dinghuensis TaxID=2906761 RepID=UPI0020A7854E|nr:cytochrome C [Myxococcus dinghuensis]MCP3101898.1 cytochrome C [Myxococcus dinghuensis]